MTRLLWLRFLRHLWRSSHSRRVSPRKGNISSRRRVRPFLEGLEERITPTTYNVTDVASLQNAIISAREDTGPDTIVLAPGQYNLSNQLAIYNPNPNFSLTIKGSGATASATVIDGTNDNDGVSMFLLLAVNNVVANVTFEDLTIQHGHTTAANTTGDTGGGGIADIGDNLTLANVVVQSNTAESSATNSIAKGGGLYVYNASLTITESVFRNNSAFGANAGTSSKDGGDAEGGGIYFEATTGLQQLSIANSTIADNLVKGGDGNTEGLTGGGGAFGGGIAAAGPDGATLTFGDSTLSGNSATGGRGNGPGPGPAEGGGAYINLSNSTFINSTIANNIAISDGSAQGGGVFFGPGSGFASLTNATVAYNQVEGLASPVVCGGLENDNGTTQRVQLTNTLVALNTAQIIDGAHVLDGEDVLGNFLSGGHNLIDNAVGVVGTPFTGPGDLAGTSQNPLNPVLGPLANNGGPTQTIALLPGSPAINAGDNNAQAVTGPFDQRGQGFARLANGAMDIGAFEVQPPSPPPPAPPPSPPPHPAPPPMLHTPPLLAFFDAFLHGAETVNSNGTETVIDRLFGLPLLVSTYDSAGHLRSVTLFGFNVTLLFELL